MNKMKCFGFLLVTSQFAFAATYDLSKAKNEVTFLAIGQPSALKIKGEAKGNDILNGTLKVEGSTVSGTAQLKLASLDTGIEMRDSHMKEKYLEVQKHPLAELLLGQAGNGSFTGQLKLHGTSQAVSGKSVLELKDKNLKFLVEFSVLLKDYLIEIPSYLGIKVANDVKVSASTEGSLL